MNARDNPPPVMDEEVTRLRVPPHSSEAEQSILGGLLLDNGAWDRVGDAVTGADFYRHEHRLIFEAIGTMVCVGKPADVVTVFEHLQRAGQIADVGGLPYLNALAQSVPSAASIRRYAEIVRERAMLRKLIAAAGDATELAWAAQDAQTVSDQIATIFGALQQGQVRKAPRLISDLMVGRIDHYEALAAGTEPRGWPTSIPGLDRMLNGGLRAGKVYVLAARPKVGKSSLAQQIAMQLAGAGLPAMILSQEMEASELVDRAIANKGRVNYSDLITGKMSEDQWGRLSEGADVVQHLPLWLDDQAALTLGAIRAKARSVKGLKLLVIDYLQLCSGSGRKGDNRNTEIEEISRGVKALAKDLGIAVLMLSQLNREVEKRASKRPNLSDLRDSGSIEQDADAVIFLWPARDFDAPGHRLIGCAVDANRSGACGEFALDFQGNHQLWRESTESLAQPARSFAANRKGYEE